VRRFKEPQWLIYADYRVELDKHKYMFDRVFTEYDADTNEREPRISTVDSKVVNNKIHEWIVVTYKFKLGVDDQYGLFDLMPTILGKVKFEKDKASIDVNVYWGSSSDLSIIWYGNSYGTTIEYSDPAACGEKIFKNILNRMGELEEEVIALHHRVHVLKKLTKAEKSMLRNRRNYW